MPAGIGSRSFFATYLSQLAENNLCVVLLLHLVNEGIQVVFDNGGIEAAGELIYIIV